MLGGDTNACLSQYNVILISISQVGCTITLDTHKLYIE